MLFLFFCRCRLQLFFVVRCVVLAHQNTKKRKKNKLKKNVFKSVAAKPFHPISQPPTTTIQLVHFIGFLAA